MTRRISYFAFIAIVGLLAGQSVMAQGKSVAIDSQYSTARLFLASSKSPDPFINAGVARVSGHVRWNDNDPSRSLFEFTAYPADGSEPYINVPETGSYTVISFKSKRVEPEGENAYRVTGDLTVTQAERQATYGPSESYSGPVYGPVVVHSAKQEAVFEFKRAQAGSTMWLATSIVTAEELPELLTAIGATDWPEFVVEEHCVVPANVGEDYSGPSCTEQTVDRTARTDIQCEMPATLGEGYSGEQCTGTPLQVPTNTRTQTQLANAHLSEDSSDQLVANEVRIQVELQLTQPSSARLGTSGQ